jgi:hypothetical protein
MANKVYTAITSCLVIARIEPDGPHTGSLLSARDADAVSSASRLTGIRSPGANHPLQGPPGGRT